VDCLQPRLAKYTNLTKQKSAKQDIKIISKKYWQDMKNFAKQILIKLGGFYLIKMNLIQTVL